PDPDIPAADLGRVLVPLARVQRRGRAEGLGDLAAEDLLGPVLERLRRPRPLGDVRAQALQRLGVALALGRPRLDALDPLFLPVDAALGLTAAVAGAVAA